MYKKNFAFLCCELLLLVTSSSKSQENSINNEEEGDNLMARYEIDTDSTTIYDNKITTLQHELYEESSNNTIYEMQNEFRIISKKNDREENVDAIPNKLNRRSVHYSEDDDKIPIASHTNSTNVNHRDNFTSQEIYEYSIEKNYSTSYEVENSSENGNEIVPYKMCHNITCILLCCPLGNRMNPNNGECISENNEYGFPNVSKYTNDLMQSEDKKVDELYKFAIHDSCRNTMRFVEDKGYHYDYTIFANGSIYFPYYELLFKSTSYCLGVFLERGNKWEVTFCFEIIEQFIKNDMNTPEGRSRILTLKIFSWMHVVCILFLVPVFLVYSILPKLRNVHGYMLRQYTAASCLAIIINAAKTMHYKEEVSHSVCITLAFLEYFFIMSTFFWLSATSFNMWWTFREFSSLQRNIKQSETKKLVYYTIFAYGCPFILGIVCVVFVDFISDYIPLVIRPDFTIGNCWFNSTGPYLLYFYAIKSVCIISSICLSISAAVKIRHYEKDTNFRLTDSESKRYNDNKKWFNLYMQLFITLFILMALNWTLLTTSWIFGTTMEYYIPYIIGSLDIVGAFCTFIIFVWKKKIMLMLLELFGCKMNKVSNT